MALVAVDDDQGFVMALVDSLQEVNGKVDYVRVMEHINKNTCCHNE